MAEQTKVGWKKLSLFETGFELWTYKTESQGVTIWPHSLPQPKTFSKL
jgi:hypothetical protein